MTEKLSKSVNIPVWLIGMLASLFLAFMGFTISVTANANVIKEKVLQNELKVQANNIALQKKASQKDVDRLYEICTRIENKIDELNKKQ